MSYLTKTDDKKSRESLAAYNDGYSQALRNEPRNASSYESIHERQMYSMGYTDGQKLYEIRRLRSES